MRKQVKYILEFSSVLHADGNSTEDQLIPPIKSQCWSGARHDDIGDTAISTSVVPAKK